MARIHPEGWRQIDAAGTAARKLETLSLLSDALSDDYAIYHDIHWTRITSGRPLFGGIDFVIVGPAGRLLLIEQKSGFLDETPQGLMQTYARGKRNVSVRLAQTLDSLRARLSVFFDGHQPRMDALLYCPDYRVRQPGSAGIAPERIVDAARREELPFIVRELLRDDETDRVVLDGIDRFLADELELVPEVNAIVGQAHALYTRLSGGLTEWARRIDMTPLRLRITGTAGSGKTQLAMAVLRDAVTAGRRSLYVCYNRPLADHIALIAPSASVVATYHQLCDRMSRAAGMVPDFSQPDVFARMEQTFESMAISDAARFDEIIVDEGQDFRPGWGDNVLRLLKPEGRAWWLEDPMQNLYDRPATALPGWVRLSSERNYRSPADILSWFNHALSLPQPLEAGSPLHGGNMEIETWTTHDELLDKTRRAITRCIGVGFRRDMIALVTYRGRENSLFSAHERIGQYNLKAFTGKYDLLGNPVYSEGDILIDSVHRFKGQAAPCIVFTEIDFETLDTAAMRKLFVGATRASLKLIMVMSERSRRLLRSETG